MLGVADRIRSAASVRVLKARQAGEGSVVIRAGDIARELKLINRTPSVISALGSKQFQEENRVKLERREGPVQSTTTLFIFQICDSGRPSLDSSPFMAMRGAAKETFQALGGGAEFIARERKEFYSE